MTSLCSILLSFTISFISLFLYISPNHLNPLTQKPSAIIQTTNSFLNHFFFQSFRRWCFTCSTAVPTAAFTQSQNIRLSTSRLTTAAKKSSKYYSKSFRTWRRRWLLKGGPRLTPRQWMGTRPSLSCSSSFLIQNRTWRRFVTARKSSKSRSILTFVTSRDRRCSIWPAVWETSKLLR